MPKMNTQPVDSQQCAGTNYWGQRCRKRVRGGPTCPHHTPLEAECVAGPLDGRRFRGLPKELANGLYVGDNPPGSTEPFWTDDYWKTQWGEEAFGGYRLTRREDGAYRFVWEAFVACGKRSPDETPER